MLVLTRQTEQQILFPDLGVRVRVLKVRDRIVKLGVDAPPEIQILRDEIRPFLPPPKPSPASSRVGRESSDQAEHRRRNELNVLQLRLDILQERIYAGEVINAAMLIDTLSERARPIADQRVDPNGHLCDDDSAGDDHAAGVAWYPPVRLLVVEDSDNERGLLTHVLASQGFIVHVARDGGEAHEQLRQWSTLPDVVLMDMRMPLHDGLEGLRRIREDNRLWDMLVYAVTGMPQVSAQQPIGRGWDRWFTKPVAVADLIQAIHLDVRLRRPSSTTLETFGGVACPKV